MKCSLPDLAAGDDGPAELLWFRRSRKRAREPRTHRRMEEIERPRRHGSILVDALDEPIRIIRTWVMPEKG